MVFMEETLFTETFDEIAEMNKINREWNRCEILFCLESSSDGKKDGIIQKAINLIKKILSTVKEMIVKISKNIDQKIRYGALSKSKKEEYNRFCKFVEQNPEIKQKKISVKDWQRIYREYDIIEKNIVTMMNDDKVDADGLTLKTHELFNNFNDLLNSGSAVITVETAMTLAKKSPEMARLMQETLLKNQDVVKNIESQLGQKEVTRLQNKVNKLAKEAQGCKLLTALYAKKEKSISECMTELMDSFKDLDTVKGKVKFAIQHADVARTASKAYIKNEDTRKAVKTAVGMKKDFDKSLSDKNSILGTVSEFINPKVNT